MPEQHASGRPAEWVVLRTAEQLSAEIWRATLRAAGIPAQLAPGDTMSFLGVTPAPVRLVVPAELVAAAERVLGELEAADRAAESDGV